MKEKNIYLISLTLITFIVCFSLVGYGLYSIDEESYTYLTQSIFENKQFHFQTDYAKTNSQLHRAHLSVVSEDNVYSAFPPGYPFLAVPFYYIFGIEGMQIANIFFTVLLILSFYYFLKMYYNKKEAFFGSIILLSGTQILNYSVSLWSHVSAALFLLLSTYMLLLGRPFFSGLFIGAGIVVRYSGIVFLPVFLAYLYFKKRSILHFILAFFIGVMPLILYNYLSFGSPFTSGMSILNAEEGYNVVNLYQIPKGIITNLLHYNFFPELEFYDIKGSLLETSPIFAFFLIGIYYFYKENKELRKEVSTIIASPLLFIFFISGTWSFGGLAHNMRLLTDIVPFIAFFSLVPLFTLGLDYKRIFSGSLLFALIIHLIGVSYLWVKFYSLIASIIIILASIGLLLLKKEVYSKTWKKFVTLFFILSIGMSVFTSISFTIEESNIRRSVGEAAKVFEESVPDGSVVFIFGGEYSAYTAKDYIFLDYRHAPDDIDRVIEFYENKPKYVLFKDEADKEKFSEFRLQHDRPPRTYKILK